MNKDFYNFY